MDRQERNSWDALTGLGEDASDGALTVEVPVPDMMKLWCVVINGGYVFSVQIELSAKEHDLQESIKQVQPEIVKSAAEELELYVAKKENGG